MRIVVDTNVETISTEDIAKQQENFDNLLTQLGKANAKEIDKALSLREIVEPEPELTPDVINRLKAKIKNKKL